MSSLILINADTDQEIGMLNDGDVLTLNLLPTTNLNVRADTSPATVGSVVFGLDGEDEFKIESIAPYALAGDIEGDYNPWTPSPGAHTLTATPYDGAAGSGTAGTPLAVSLTVAAVGDFENWLAAFTFAPGADLSGGGDPHGDGLSTWTEYLFGLNPSEKPSASPITAGLSLSAGIFSYMRRNPALTGITNYQIWVSEDLSNWVLDDTANQTPDGDAEIQDVTVTLTGFPLFAPELFVRVGVN